MTQENSIIQTPHHCGVPRDYIPDLDAWTHNMFIQMVELIIHFTGKKWCVFCKDAIMVTESDEVFLDIHMWEEHGEEAVIDLYVKLMKEHVIPALSSP